MAAIARATRQNVDYWLGKFRERVGAPYVYGGELSATDTRQGCDCSALVAHALNGVLYGPDMTWRRVDPTNGNAWITTESWRPIDVGQTGPFGTITVGSPSEIPADAAVKIALHHGPGGGAASHTWCEVDGVAMESGGDKGLCTAPRALRIDSPYGNDWAYLPGPIARADHRAPGTEPELLAVGSRGPAVEHLQTGLRKIFPWYAGHVTLDGEYGPETAAAIAEFQRRVQLPPTGSVDEQTRQALQHYGIDFITAGDLRSPAVGIPDDAIVLLREIWEQLRGPGGNGWPQLGNRSLVDAISEIGEWLVGHE
jgi:hypothetical protein